MKFILLIIALFFSLHAFSITWTYHANPSTEELTTTVLQDSPHLFYLNNKISCLIIPSVKMNDSYFRSLSCEIEKNINVSTNARCTVNQVIDSGFMALYIGNKTYYVGINCTP